MEKEALEITKKDLEANIVFLKQEQKKEAAKLKEKIAKKDAFDSAMDKLWKDFEKKSLDLHTERELFEAERNSFYKDKEDIQLVIDGLNKELVGKCEELDELDRRILETKRGDSEIRRTIALLKATKERLQQSVSKLESEEKELLGRVEGAKKLVEEGSGKLSLLSFNRSEIEHDLKKSKNELQKVKAEKEKVEEDLLKIRTEYKEYSDILSKKKRNVSVIVNRLEKKYNEAFPHLRLNID